MFYQPTGPSSRRRSIAQAILLSGWTPRAAAIISRGVRHMAVWVQAATPAAAKQTGPGCAKRRIDPAARNQARGRPLVVSRTRVGSAHRLSSDRLDRCDNTLCSFNDLAGIETQVLAEARRQDLRAPASDLHDCRLALRGQERRARARLGWRGWNPAGALLPPLLYRDVRRRRVAERGLNVSTGSIAPLHAHCKRVRSRTRIRPSDPLV